jgi:solute carrier family 35 protein
MKGKSHAKYEEGTVTFFSKAWSAVFYAASSTAVILINKVVLTSYNFPSFLFLALCQFLSTTFVLLFLFAFQKVCMYASIRREGTVIMHTMLFTCCVASLSISNALPPRSLQVDLPRLDRALFLEIAPISIFYFGNVLSGLGGTQSLNLPMFTVLRRFSIAMTMLGEYYILHKKPSSEISLSVLAMVLGALVAAVNDLSFDLVGYVMVCTYV